MPMLFLHIIHEYKIFFKGNVTKKNECVDVPQYSFLKGGVL